MKSNTNRGVIQIFLVILIILIIGLFIGVGPNQILNNLFIPILSFIWKIILWFFYLIDDFILMIINFFIEIFS